MRVWIAILGLSMFATLPTLADEPSPTRKFEVRKDRPFLDGQAIDIWGIRCGNAP